MEQEIQCLLKMDHTEQVVVVAAADMELEETVMTFVESVVAAEQLFDLQEEAECEMPCPSLEMGIGREKENDVGYLM